MNKLKKCIPNVITGSRIVTSILAPILFLNGSIGIGIGLYCYGVISDFLDGYTARKFDAFSELGRKMDAVSDKLFALSIAVPSIVLGNFFMLIPVALEGLISLINGYYQNKGVKPRTIWVGKYKTALLFMTMVMGLGMCKIPFLINLFIPSLVVSTKFQVQTACEYVNEYRKLLDEKDNGVYEEEPLDIVRGEALEKKDVSLKEKIGSMGDEFVYYATKNVEIKPGKKKIKILRL